MDNTAKILILCVNYQKYKLTEVFIDNILKFEKNNIDIVVVDNQSTDRYYNELVEKFQKNKKLHFFSSIENLGYLGGANWGFNKINNQIYDFVIIANNDICIEDIHFFDKLEKYRDKENVGGIAPKIILKNHNINQNPYIDTFKKWHKYYHYFFYINYPISLIRFYLSIMKKKIRLKDKPLLNEKDKFIYAFHGSFMIITKYFFKKGGTINYPVFLFGEEEFLAKQCKKMGLNIIYTPDIKLIHDEHQSTKSDYTFQKFILLKKAFKYNYIERN